MFTGNWYRPDSPFSDKFRRILTNEMYLGNTINMRFSRKSYKDRRKIEHPREECLVFENTHPALVTKEVWDTPMRGHPIGEGFLLKYYLAIDS